MKRKRQELEPMEDLECFKCPITQMYIEHPVKCNDCGVSFERSAIFKWEYATRKTTCPNCRAVLSMSDVNEKLKKEIADAIDSGEIALDEEEKMARKYRCAIFGIVSRYPTTMGCCGELVSATAVVSYFQKNDACPLCKKAAKLPMAFDMSYKNRIEKIVAAKKLMYEDGEDPKALEALKTFVSAKNSSAVAKKDAEKPEQMPIVAVPRPVPALPPKKEFVLHTGEKGNRYDCPLFLVLVKKCFGHRNQRGNLWITNSDTQDLLYGILKPYKDALFEELFKNSIFRAQWARDPPKDSVEYFTLMDNIVSCHLPGDVYEDAVEEVVKKGYSNWPPAKSPIYTLNFLDFAMVANVLSRNKELVLDLMGIPKWVLRSLVGGNYGYLHDARRMESLAKLLIEAGYNFGHIYNLLIPLMPEMAAAIAKIAGDVPHRSVIQ